MAFDQSKVGRLTAELMEDLENRYAEGAEIGDVCLIVEVVGPHGSDVTVRASQGRRHVNLGLLRMAEECFTQGQ